MAADSVSALTKYAVCLRVGMLHCAWVGTQDMAFEAVWLIPERVFCIRLSGTLTAEALDEALTRFQAVLKRESSLATHVILDLTPSQRDETLLPKLKKTIDELRNMHPPAPRAGWTVIVDTMPNQIVKSIGASITQVIRIRTRFLTNVDEALPFLRQIDATLPPVS